MENEKLNVTPEETKEPESKNFIEQIIILGEGATRVSAREFQKEIREMKHHIRKNYTEVNQIRRNSLMDQLSPEQSALLEQLRLKETE